MRPVPPPPRQAQGGSELASPEAVSAEPLGSGTARISAVSALVLLAIVFAWWGIKQGAYFGVVFYPGLVLLCAGLVLLSSGAPWRGDLRLSRPTALALGGIFGLAAWSALSALWSPSPDVAIADAQRISGYGVCFGLGLWLVNLLGPRMHLALAPVAIGGGIAGLAAVGVMLFGDDLRSYLETDGTLQYPIGYRNANAAFFAIALWPALALARSQDLRWWSRAAALGTATLCIELALLSQSRGSVVGIAVALLAFVVFAEGRARALGWLLLAILPALIVLPALGDLYAAARDFGRADTLNELRSAGAMALAGAGVAAVLAAGAVWLERRFPLSPAGEKRADRLATGAVIVGLIAGVAGFIIATGDPIDWAEERVDQFRNEGTPSFEGASSRFGFDTGTERLDLWRVAVDDGAADPVFGDGGGGFQYTYLRDRTNAEQNARDAHSVELEVFAELGVPGLALLGLTLVAATVGALRARRLGPAAAILAGAALTAGAYWLAHASIDWFWAYAGVTAPVFLLMGAACGPGIRAPRQRRGAGRRWAIAGAVVLALSVVPAYLSERYTNEAFRTWRADPARAFDDLYRARDLNPLAEEPLLAEGVIAQELDDRQRALDAFSRAAERRPDEWATYYFLARLHLESSPERAARDLAVALDLNPLSPRLQALEEQIDRKLARATRRRE